MRTLAIGMTSLKSEPMATTPLPPFEYMGVDHGLTDILEGVHGSVTLVERCATTPA
jgi:hypothetical protein